MASSAAGRRELIEPELEFHLNSVLTEAAMNRTFRNRLSSWVIATIGVGAIGVGTMLDGASAGSFTRGCAARDLQILFLIEEQESAGSVPAERLSDALIEMMHARIVCHEGRVLDALAIYDAVAENLRPIRSGRAHVDGFQ